MRSPSCQRHWPESSTAYSPTHFMSASFRVAVSVANDEAVSAGAGGGCLILFKEGDCELRQADSGGDGAGRYGGREFAGDEGLLRTGRDRGGDVIAAVEGEVGAGLALVVSGIDVHDKSRLLGAVHEDGHFGDVADADDI